MSQSSNLDQDMTKALDAYFQERLQQVPLLQKRAKEEGISQIRGAADVIPLLFPHITFKSYPEVLVSKGRWPQLNRWLDSLSTYRVDNVDVSGVRDLDGWMERLHAAGHLVSSSSGTSGKSSFLNKTARDVDLAHEDLLACFTWLGLPSSNTWNVVTTMPDNGIRSYRVTRDFIVESFRRPDGIPLPPDEEQTVGHHAYMSRLSAMRRAMADGTARPDEVAAFEAEAAGRQVAGEAHLRYFAERILARPSEPMLFTSMFPALYRLCEILREMGAAEGTLTADNALMVAGGLKGVALPPDYQDQIFRLLNIDPSRFLHFYAMQEINLKLPKCLRGRYHVPARLALFVLDRPGEALAPVSDGMAEGRAAFVDITVDGRWGGTMSGDRVTVDFGPCACGRPGPTVLSEITRYSDSIDGDKITCAGTMDAYVRGFLAD
ncbi:hypothetical protein MXD63_17280 [Frankia sp. Cpl3]|nr:hypothetical protein [Frankia sp. Cpl3]